MKADTTIIQMGDEWDTYFDYFRQMTPDGYFCYRNSKKGYEYLEHEHGNLEHIKSMVLRKNIKNK